MQGNQRRFAVETLTVWRVADNRTVRPFRLRVGQVGDIFHLESNQLADTRTTGVAARTFNHARIAVRTVEVGGVLRQAFTCPGLSVRFHLFPDSFIVLRPAFEAPLAAVQSRRAVGGQHSRFNQQRTGAAHRVEQWRAWLPAGAHHDGGGQGFFDRCHTGAIAVATQM